MNKVTTSLLGRAFKWGVWLALAAAATCNAQTSTITRTSSFEYDGRGLLIREVVEPDRPDDCLSTTYTHDGFGNRVSSATSACPGASGQAVSSAASARSTTSLFQGNSHTFWGASYGGGMFPSHVTNALGQTETREFDPKFGAVTKLTGPNGLITYWAYDPEGRKYHESRADNTMTQWTYQLCTYPGAGCPASINGVSPAWVVTEQSTAQPQKRQYHDMLDRVIRVETQGFDGTGVTQVIVQDTVYNALGQVLQRSQPYDLSAETPVWTTFEYDALGRVLTQTSTDVSQNGSYVYNGLSTSITNAKGQTKTTVRHFTGQTERVIDATGGMVTYSYDALGQLIETDAAGQITTLSYDQRGRKVGMVDPSMGQWSYAYNVFGELVSQTDSLSQTTTMAYDLLGRMVQRSEPDLESNWSYDKKADGTSCGAGIGKLCEASTTNGYRRVHNYDSLGRPDRTITVLDSTSAPAESSVTYDGQRPDRISSRTWPATSQGSYQAKYFYTNLGFLARVTGSGAGTSSASYEVLGMNARGQITSYRYGNQVTTVNTHEPGTNRLAQRNATLAGAVAGGVMSHTYTYDSLGSLATRADANSGVSEAFQYDALNRLTQYSAVGGAVSAGSPNSAVQVIYDARGNISYKSDVGYYWYDPLRPNRITQVTLDAPAGALPLTGTRYLSHVFDDYYAGAKSVNGTSMGNGNLMYTVSLDSITGRNTVRWESYTSFNMPLQMRYANLANATASTSSGTVDATPVYSCPDGQTLNGTTCLIGSSVPATFRGYRCLAGQTLSGDQCTWVTITTATSTTVAEPDCSIGHTYEAGVGCRVVMYDGEGGSWSYTYPNSWVCAGGTLTGNLCTKSTTTSLTNSAPATPYYTCSVSGQTVLGNQCLSGTITNAIVTGYKCSAGQTVLGDTCVWTMQSTAVSTIAATPACPSGGTYVGAEGCQVSNIDWESYTTYYTYYPNTWTCPAGATLSGSSCNKTLIVPLNLTMKATPAYTCPGGEVLNTSGTTGVCQPAVKQAVASVSYTCPSGYQLSGQTCRQGTGTTADTSGMAADRQLDFIYGPEHQRVRQIVSLSANAPSNMHSGTTWYLHGDNNDLFYEKEIRADGTVEHKHYLSAGGITFAIQTIREGALNGKPAKTLNYLHHDHLGSTSAVTDEAGAVIERMAYDPWGKRRYANGVADTSDSIVPSSTERGFTMHEHLDELGIIHMNGRIYDPYTGRFMSADPFIQDPGNLQSYNRYAYVMNNPLNLTDPSGYFSLKKFLRTAISIYIMWQMPGWLDVNGFQVAGMNPETAKMINAAASAFVAAQVSTGGNLKAGLNAALTAGMFSYVGGLKEISDTTRVLAHGAVGCVSAVAGSGKCGAGFSSAVFGKFTTLAVEQGPNWLKGDITRGVVTTIAGGIGSKLAGGKFDNGAATAAMGYLFNYLSQAARTRLIGAGAFLGGTAGAVAAGGCTAGTGGVCALGAPTMIAGGAAGGALAADAIANAWDQLDNLLSKATNAGPQSVQYALVAERSGLYPTVGGDLVQLNAGDVWKYGISTDPAGRYPAQALSVLGLRMDIQAVGTLPQVYVAEKIQLINYAVSNGSLPPGNRIFK